MTPIQQLMLGLGASKKTYLDDIFSTYLYPGVNSGSTTTINNGIKNLSNGGLVWLKTRTSNRHHVLFDSTSTSALKPSSNSARSSYGSYAPTWTDTGLTLPGGDGDTNLGGGDYLSWNFRKSPGFCDIITYTGNAVDGREISHSLGCSPGLILFKRTDGTGHWFVWHRKFGLTQKALLNTNGAAGSMNTSPRHALPNATTITLTDWDEENGDGHEFVAYIFAGGESTAATARCIDLDNSTGNNIEVSSTVNAGNPIPEFGYGTGDFTWEAYFKSEGDTGTSYILSHSGGNHVGGLYLSSNHPNQALSYINSSNNNMNADGQTIYKGQWYHVAVSRNSGTTRFFVNGLFCASVSDNHNYPSAKFYVGTNPGGDTFNGQISNVRIIKGTGLYTSSFKVPTEPLTNVTNTVLLCCNNSSATGATVLPSATTITGNSSPGVSTDSPFDDPAAFIFGENEDQGVIKCGSYIGNASSTVPPEIHLGWEPQWIMLKRTDADDSWAMYDVMRGMVTGGSDNHLRAEQGNPENTGDTITVTPTGFKLEGTDTEQNADGGEYLYIAIRRPDGYVGKPIEDATKCFAIDEGTESGDDIPNYISGFPVDWALRRKFASQEAWFGEARLMGENYINPNTNQAQTSYDKVQWDSNTGYSEDERGDDGLAWMWKRHAGFDVVCYKGYGSGNLDVKHSLGKTPEMIWVKRRNAGSNWCVGHKGFNGGTNPWNYFANLNETAEASEGNYWTQGTTPTAIKFSVNNAPGNNLTNNGGDQYIALLFASVAGISSVGSWTGDGTSNNSLAITTGFSPRFVLIHRESDTGGNWLVIDTQRGFTKYLRLQHNIAESTNTFITATSTGFTLNSSDADINASGSEYIYYAHA